MSVTGMEPLPPLAPPPGRSALPVGRWFLLAGTAVALVVAVAVTAILMALGQTLTARDTVVDVIDPAALQTLRITTALQAQGSAVRAYGLTNERQYLDEYRRGVADEQAATAAILALTPRLPEPDQERRELERLSAATAAWRHDYTEKVVAAVPTAGTGALTRELATVNVTRFAEVRAALAARQARLDALHDLGSRRLRAGWDTIYTSVWVLIGALVLAVAGCTVIVRRAVTIPVARLTRQVRAVAAGDFDHELGVERPAELWELSGHVDGMRRRIMAEWRAASEARRRLAEQAEELRRSNAELEQFAYVASHDLQEPLRKVASFTRLLDQRYGDRLDDRARQYMAFAVDGATRMQELIEDLLDLSRVGRTGGERVPTDSGVALRGALRNLDTLLTEAGAEVTHDPMPMVVGNASLLTQVFQNLVGNAVKFRSQEPPRVHVGVRRDGEMWEFSCSDNGIGIDPKHAERIFLIFQRLHPRDVHPGTGIGLSLCRKIVEYHGGRIWLDTAAGPGATFRWTLPAAGDAG
ncbi:sensor histidine kinase [Microbispora corallina]|uniref:histidine kinase n=2 Tax=Microbispora corallina TaxID=83302 RepID=A0ABQ4G0G4_9ACTN|nr:histidine kinase [Microbispora corallina]